MKTIKTIICIILSVLVFGSLIPIVSGASDGSVYASQEEQDYIYSCSQMELSNVRSLLERYGIRLLKESITPVYTLDMLAFAANDVFEILPLEYSSESDCRQVYMAKTVFENNGFAGNIGFFIKDGVAQLLYLNPSNIIEEYKDNDMFQASCSYADHASRIAALLGSNEIIPPENVRYVHLKGYKHGLGDCFYVCVGGDGYFIPVGSISTEYVPVAVDNAITISELKAIALEDEEKYNEHTISMEEWRKAHPGESWHPVGSGSEGVVTIISSSSVDNIIAVNNFFSERCSSVNDKENSYHLISNDANEGSLQSDTQKVKKPAVLLYFAIPSTALMLIALSILIFLKRRNRKDILP